MRCKRLLLQVSSIALVMCPAALRAEPGDTSTMQGTARAELIATGAIQRQADMRFGAFMQPSTSGTILVRPNGTFVGTGGVVSGMTVIQPIDGRGPARFLVNGTPNRFLLVQVPTQIVISSGSATMAVRNLTSNTLFGFSVFNAAGQFTLNVGGTLQVAANQPVGNYAGNFQITVLFL